jgi:hypothetical protein
MKKHTMQIGKICQLREFGENQVRSFMNRGSGVPACR